MELFLAVMDGARVLAGYALVFMVLPIFLVALAVRLMRRGKTGRSAAQVLQEVLWQTGKVALVLIGAAIFLAWFVLTHMPHPD